MSLFTNTKPIADTLTFSRIGIAFWIGWLGFARGRSALPVVAILLVIAWATDVFDGMLARRDPRGITTWIGDNDLSVDIVVSMCVWIYLWSAGWITPAFGAGYLLSALAILFITRSIHVGWAIQSVPYGAILYFSYLNFNVYFWIMVGWILTIVIITWPRLPEQTLPDFFTGIGGLMKSDKD